MKGPAAESQHAPADRVNGEHHPLAELVHQTAVFTLYGKTGGEQVLGLVPCGHSGVYKGCAARRSPAEPETGDGGVLEPTLAEVLVAHGAPLRRFQLLCIKLLGELAHEQQALAPLPAGDFFRRLLLLDYVYLVLCGQIAESLDVAAVLVLHHETHGGTGLAAAKALVDALCWRHVERRGLLVMEGTACHIVGPAALERHEIPDHVLYPGSIENQVDCLLGNHEAISHKNFMRTRRTSISS